MTFPQCIGSICKIVFLIILNELETGIEREHENVEETKNGQDDVSISEVLMHDVFLMYLNAFHMHAEFGQNLWLIQNKYLHYTS